MTIGQLSLINALYARYCRLTQLIPAKDIDTGEALWIAGRLSELGLELDWDDTPKDAA